MNVKHRWVLMYDIREPKRLQKVARLADAFGNRIQKSVYEIYTDNLTIDNIEKSIKILIEEEDSFALIPVCLPDWEKTIRLGTLEKHYTDPKEEENLFL